MKVYNQNVEIIDSNDDLLQFFMKDTEELHKIEIKSLVENESLYISEYHLESQVLFEYSLSDQSLVYLYTKDNRLNVLKESADISPFKDHKEYFPYIFENEHYKVSLKRFGLARIGLVDENNCLIHMIEEVPTNNKIDFEIEYEMGFTSTFFRFTTISIAKFDRYHIVLTYDLFRKVIRVRKIMFSQSKPSKLVQPILKSQNEINIVNQLSGQSIRVNFRSMGARKTVKLFELEELKGCKNQNILSVFTISGMRFFIYVTSKGVYLGKNNPYRVTGHGTNLRLLKGISNIYFYGRFTHYAYNASGKYETLYLQDENHKIGDFVRPFSSVPLLRRYGFFKVPFESLFINDKIHNNFFVGDKNNVIHNLKRKYKDKKVKTLLIKKTSEQINVIRTNLGGNLTSTIIPYSKEYSIADRTKIKLAHLISKWTKPKGKNVNLYFEKKSDKADESGFRVFEQVMNRNNPNSINYFVLNKNSTRYKELKSQYGNSIVSKYSFKHYLSIFQADHFISSELSNHLLNDRLYIDNLRSRLMEVPLVFLQHGIMFAKPVDNPMAFGFHKDKNLYNMYKSVISSKLEAKEFYKMGYSDEDLILTGLSTFDFAKLNDGADKIAYMPTYRYWEEGLIYKGEIENTSYYIAIMKVIRAFEKAGLMDRLLIVPHNKFTQFIYENMPEYKHIISDNPSEALKESIVFITDYSSAIYDSIFRGAYPIFYWEEKDYLIRQYRAIPPVNEDNAPGPVAMNADELIKLVQNAIDRNYSMEQEYKNRYKKINTFDDRKNTQRIVEFLNQEKIL